MKRWTFVFITMALIATILLVVGLHLPFNPFKFKGIDHKTTISQLTHSTLGKELGYDSIFSIIGSNFKADFGAMAYHLWIVAIVGAILWFINSLVFLYIVYLWLKFQIQKTQKNEKDLKK